MIVVYGIALDPFGQPWNLSVAPNVQAALSKTSVGPPQVISTPASGIASAGISQPPAMEVKSNGRKELPAVMDLIVISFISCGDPSDNACPYRS